VDRRVLLYHVRATRFDAAIVATTAISAVAISVEFCVLIGVFLSFMLAVPRAGRMLLTEFVLAERGRIHERLPGDEPCPRLLIFGLEGELFFGSSSNLEQHFRYIEDRVDANTRVVVLRVKRVRNPDAVGLTLLAEFLERMKPRDVHVILCGVRSQLFESMRRSGLAARLGEGEIFLEQPVRQTSTMLAIRHAYELIPDPCPACPRRNRSAQEIDLYYDV
jgi:SulP family sulfate permease